VTIAGRIEVSFQRRVRELPGETRRSLLVAAAEPVGDTTLLWRAAERLGIDLSAVDAAKSDGLMEIDGGAVTSRHPLVRSAVYRLASPEERRAAHGALAEATDPEIDPDRRAGHRAHAAPGADAQGSSSRPPESTRGRSSASST
jgi:hypothetical protein